MLKSADHAHCYVSAEHHNKCDKPAEFETNMNWQTT